LVCALPRLGRAALGAPVRPRPCKPADTLGEEQVFAVAGHEATGVAEIVCGLAGTGGGEVVGPAALAAAGREVHNLRRLEGGPHRRLAGAFRSAWHHARPAGRSVATDRVSRFLADK